MKDRFRYLVLGLGGLGSAAAYWLARRAGADVLGLERFELGHDRGESQDHSRIIRLTYHTPAYVEFARQAYAAWAELEADSGEQVVLRTGELNLWPPVTTLDEQAYLDSLDVCGVPYERLDNVEVMRRFPQFRLGDDIHAIYQAQGGLAAAARGNAAHQRMARAHGATLIDNTPVESIRPVDGEYEVVCGAGVFRCEKLAVAAGPWTNGALAHFGMALPLQVTKEQVTYFAAPDLAEFAPERFPVWIWMIEDNYYGFPVFGAEAVKVAKDIFEPVDPDARTFAPDRDNEEALLRFLGQHLPEAVGPILYTKTCLLTHTPDVDFVLDRVPGHPACAVAVGAGHAYKFASLIGRTLSELLIDGTTDRDIGAFRLDRASLAGPG